MRHRITLLGGLILALALVAACSHDTAVRASAVAHSVDNDARHDVRQVGHTIEHAADDDPAKEHPAH